MYNKWHNREDEVEVVEEGRVEVLYDVRDPRVDDQYNEIHMGELDLRTLLIGQ